MANQALPLTPPKGMRDFGAEEMRKRRFIFERLRNVFLTFGFDGIETPSMERMEVLTGKYGQEGDRLIFKVLNSGDFMKAVQEAQLPEPNSKQMLGLISEKALRYDLTIPFARFVSAHRGTLPFPFKRHQIQAVWRADQPQKGRYREFYQCDVDVVGSRSLWQEVELVRVFAEGFAALGIEGAQIQINHRGLLMGLAERLEMPEKAAALIGILDKSDKLPSEALLDLFRKEGLNAAQLALLDPLLNWLPGTLPEAIKPLFVGLENAEKGIEELELVFDRCLDLGSLPGKASLVFNPRLARGLDYYTGCIFEVLLPGSGLGSLGGGGRYDNLTDMFGVPDLSGVGISFGAERIYDYLQAQHSWPEDLQTGLDYFFLHFDEEGAKAAQRFMVKLRGLGARCDMFPEAVKIQKQMKYANQRKAKFVVSIGDRERENQEVGIKNMQTGVQHTVFWEDLPQHYTSEAYAAG